MRATASPLGDVPAATEWAPAREPVAESSEPQPSSVGIEPPTTTSVPMASNLPIPTLVGTADATIHTQVIKLTGNGDSRLTNE